MQIKTRLKIISWMATIMAILIMFIFVWTSEQTKQAAARRGFMEEIVEIALKRMVLRDEYILYHDERPKEQWLQQTENLEKRFKRVQATAIASDEKLALQQTSLWLDKTNKYFKHLTENQDDVVAGKISSAQGQEIERRIYSQLIIDAQSLLSQFLNLQRISARDHAARQFQSIFSILVSVLLLVCFIIVSTMMLARSIAKPLNRLREGIDVIATGNFDHKVGTESKDEIGQLSRAFDDMATNLKEKETGLDEARKELAATKISEDAAREFAESIINTVREPLIALDQDLRVVKVSSSFYDFFKVEPEETMRQLIYDLGNKQWDIPKLRELLETILPEKASFDNYEVEHDFVGVGRRTMLLNARQIQRVLGKERIILLAIEDITERKEIEIGLEKTRKELAAAKISEDAAREYAESIINTVREPLIALDQDLRVVTVSRSFYEFFKVIPEETMGQLIYDLGNKQWDISKLRELLETILPEKATFDNYEVEHDFTTIGKRIMLLNARQIQRALGNERVILLAIEDITERREIEIGLKKAHEELESFSYSVSHDLRAPLRGIDGWSLALLEDYKDKLGEQGREYIDLVRSETQIMGRLIDDLLMFSRQNRAEMNQQPLDMTAMAQAIISRLQQQNPTLQADFVIQPGLKALGDNNLIEIALKNLLDNAAKFSSKTSRAVIEFGQVENEGRKTFFVRDNGVGFDMAYLNKLFGVFRRLHKASEFPGTGIGLASVQRIINRHGGRIWAEAKVNEGATFYFTLKEAT
jgi:PAS domain S-box-containing protein